MSFDMIHELLVAKLSKTLKVDSTREGFPFEVEEVGSISLLPGRKILTHSIIYLRHETILLLTVVVV